MSRRSRIIVLVAALTVVGVIGGVILVIAICSPGSEPDAREFDRLATLGYPYVAADDRREVIVVNYRRVTPGMTGKDVEAILGEPDALRGLYEPEIFRPKRIGWTWWYYLEKKSPDGQAGEKLVRISFNLDKKVIAVDHWGFE